MPTYEARMKFIDERIITIEADDETEAQRKFDAGEWQSEDTVDFYSYDLVYGLRLTETI